jgi:hypothetical protein
VKFDYYPAIDSLYIELNPRRERKPGATQVMQMIPVLYMLGMGLRPGGDTESRGMDSSLSDRMRSDSLRRNLFTVKGEKMNKRGRR